MAGRSGHRFQAPGHRPVSRRKSVQSFPAFGVNAGRAGDGVPAHQRRPILLRCEITKPDGLIVLDPTLIAAVDVAAGLKDGGSILVNAEGGPETFPKLADRFRVGTVDASAVAREAGPGLEEPTDRDHGHPRRVRGVLEDRVARLRVPGDQVRSAVQDRRQRRRRAPPRRCCAFPSSGVGRRRRAGSVRMAESRPSLDIAHGVPPVSVSQTSTRASTDGLRSPSAPGSRPRRLLQRRAARVIDIEGRDEPAARGARGRSSRTRAAREPLPATTGRVCDHPCESSCNRATLTSRSRTSGRAHARGLTRRARPPAAPPIAKALRDRPA